MVTSREKSGHLAPLSGMQNRFEQFSRQAQTAQLCRGMSCILALINGISAVSKSIFAQKIQKTISSVLKKNYGCFFSWGN